jgi:hypothetical protein
MEGARVEGAWVEGARVPLLKDRGQVTSHRAPHRVALKAPRSNLTPPNVAEATTGLELVLLFAVVLVPTVVLAAVVVRVAVVVWVAVP